MKLPKDWRQRTDALLEFTVVGSFSRLGPMIRRHLFHWAPIDEGRVRGQVAVVTGATSGLGLECATALATMGARVILLVRNEALGEEVCAAIRSKNGNADVSIIVVDLGDLVSVRHAARELSRHPEVNILIHNAGAMTKEFDVTAQGIERTAAVQLVGPYLLTSLIRHQLISGCARVVWVTSGGMYSAALDVDWLEAPERDYDAVRAYASVKRAQVSLNEAWAPELSAQGVTMSAMHPGWVNTPGLRRSLPTFARLMAPFLRSPAQGVDTILWLATGPMEVSAGKLWLDRAVRSPHRLARTRRSDSESERGRLVQFCRDRSGVDVGSGQSQ